MQTTERRYDIDWLRVIAIALLLIYHIALTFQPWGIFIGFIQNNKPLVTIWPAMAFLNVWRIPLLFFVSGMGVGFALKKRNLKQLILERSRRILLPFLFGMFLIVPIHFFLLQKYYHQEIKYILSPSHLWFLANIFIYVILLSPLFLYIKKNENGSFVKAIKYLYKSPFGLLLITLPFIAEAILVNPQTFEMYALTFHGFMLGFLAFLFGYSFIIGGINLWNTLLKFKWIFLLLALALYIIRFIIFDLKAPNYLMPIESNLWIFALFGFAFKYLNHPSKALSYLSRAVYPVYIIHMAFLYLGSTIIFPLTLSVGFKLILLIIFTGLGSFISYELLIKRVRILRPLFGLK